MQNQILMRTRAPNPALMDQVLKTIQIPIRILNLIVSQAAVKCQHWLLQREPKKTRLWALCGQKQTEAFGSGSCFPNKLYLTRDLVDDACIPPHIAVPKPDPEPAPRPPAEGDPNGKKKKHAQQFAMCKSLTNFISESVNP